MKRILALIFVLALLIIVLAGCNKQIFDTTYGFDKAIVYLPNGKIIEGKVDAWTDFEDGDQIQVKIDGVTYLAHSTNVVLIAED